MPRISDKTLFILLISELFFIFLVSAIYSTLCIVGSFYVDLHHKMLAIAFWYPILFIAPLSLQAIIKCLKIKNIFGYINYIDSYKLHCIFNSKVKRVNLDTGFQSDKIEFIIDNLDEKCKKYVKNNVIYYSWLLHKKNIKAVQYVVVAILILCCNYTSYNLFPIACFFCLVGLLYAAMAAIELA